MYMLKKAWDAISNQTFTNCFRKLGISDKDAEKVINGEEDHFKELEDKDVEEDPFHILGAESIFRYPKILNCSSYRVFE